MENGVSGRNLQEKIEDLEILEEEKTKERINVITKEWKVLKRD